MLRRLASFILATLPYALIMACLVGAVWAQNYQQDVLVSPIGRRANTLTKTFTITGTTGRDTTTSFQPWRNTGFVMRAHSPHDSVDVDATVYVGYNGILEVGDSFTIADTGAVVTEVILPISRVAFIVFSAGPSNGSDVTIDSLFSIKGW